MTPQEVVNALLYAPATSLVPRGGLADPGAQYLSQWTPSALVSQVPEAAETALTPEGIESQLTPAVLTQTAIQDAALAAILAAMM